MPKIELIQGDCLEKMKDIPDGSIDAVITDPPYGLSFMGKHWDKGVPSVEFWVEMLRLLKPGGYLLSFSGTRTYHRMAVAIEDAGFEVRDMIEWVYGSGFPKSLNIGKAVDKLQGNKREQYQISLPRDNKNKRTLQLTKGQCVDSDTRSVKNSGNAAIQCKLCGCHTVSQKTGRLSCGHPKDSGAISKEAKQYEGWGTALKPAHEPICMARKPLDRWWKIKDDGKKVIGKVMTVAENVLKWGTGGINIDESRVGTEGGTRKSGEPSYKPSNALMGGLDGSLNGGGCESINAGRFPANLIHDNSEEVRECFPETNPSRKAMRGARPKSPAMVGDRNYVEMSDEPRGIDDNGGNASRFFKQISLFPEKPPEPIEYKSIIYCPKASKSERNKGCEGLEEKPKVFNGQSDKPSEDMKDVEKRFTTLPKANNHPTVKPIALMEYLINMVTKEGGTVLDPFMGSGTTGVACVNLNRDFIGIEMDEEYFNIAKTRIEGEIK